MGDEQDQLSKPSSPSKPGLPEKQERLARYEFRWAREEDWRGAVTMIWKSFMESEGKEYSREGVKSFFEFITDDDIYKAFLVGSYQMLLALDGTRIIGAATVRNRNRLSLLFVDGEYQRQGVGQTLVELFCGYLRDELGERELVVKAAPPAVGFYQKLGFAVTDAQQDYAGIRVIPMERRLEK